MKTRLIILLSFVSLSVRGQEGNTSINPARELILRAVEARRPEYVLTLADTKTGEGIPVLLMEPLKSAAFESFFPGVTAYRLLSSADLLHFSSISTLLIRSNGSPAYLATDEQVAQFIGDKVREIRSAQDAKRLVQTFADLRGYFLVDKRPDRPDARKSNEIPAALETDYKFIAEEHEGHWRVFATFLTEGHSISIHRYEFKLYKSTGSGLSVSEPVMIHLGTYVF